MNTNVVKRELKDEIKCLNKNLQQKNLSGKIVICEMTNHDGMF